MVLLIEVESFYIPSVFSILYLKFETEICLLCISEDWPFKAFWKNYTYRFYDFSSTECRIVQFLQ